MLLCFFFFFFFFLLFFRTKNVIEALESERNRIIADLLSNEIVDNILNWMLEGWYFGERESQFPAVGYVPSLRKEGPIRLFEAQQLAHDKGLLDRGPEAGKAFALAFALEIRIYLDDFTFLTWNLLLLFLLFLLLCFFFFF